MPLPAPYSVALETYVNAKDNARPERIAEVFEPDAILTFSLATPNIAFPPRTEGVNAIAKTLVSDFSKQYARCRTYYLRDVLEVSGDAVDVPWLVLMREPAAGAMRVGHGAYRWVFGKQDENGASDAGLRVVRLHIHIARMDVVPDADGALLDVLQTGLDYPWLASADLLARFGEPGRSISALAFIRAFAEPAPLADARRHFPQA
jgi:hypothetical protein